MRVIRHITACVVAVTTGPHGRHSRAVTAPPIPRPASVGYRMRSEQLHRRPGARPKSDFLRTTSPSAWMRGTLQEIGAIPAFVNFAAGGAAIAMLGVLILEALIRMGLPPLMAQAVQLTITLVLNFLYNYKVTWRDRPRTGLRRQAGLFLVTRAATQAASWFGFALLTSLGLHYQLANAVCLAGAM